MENLIETSKFIRQLTFWLIYSLSTAVYALNSDFTGIYHSCVLSVDGNIVCWGYDHYGQSTPPAGENFIQISNGVIASEFLQIQLHPGRSCPAIRILFG